MNPMSSRPPSLATVIFASSAAAAAWVYEASGEGLFLFLAVWHALLCLRFDETKSAGRGF